MFKIIGCASAFAVEMTRGGQYGEVSCRVLTRPRRLETRTGRAFPHSHSGCRLRCSFFHKRAKPGLNSRGSLQILTQNRFLLLQVKGRAG